MCDVISKTCSKTYFSPFWSHSKLRKQARDQLCKICNTLYIYEFTKEDIYKLEQLGFSPKQIYDENNFNVNEQLNIRDQFLQNVVRQIETSKNRGVPPPTIHNIKKTFKEAQNLLYTKFREDFDYIAM